jgi:hypothetical protein
MAITRITKILPDKKKVWVKSINYRCYEDLVKDGWKVYSYEDTKGKVLLDLKGVSDHYALSVETI